MDAWEAYEEDVLDFVLEVFALPSPETCRELAFEEMEAGPLDPDDYVPGWTDCRECDGIGLVDGETCRGCGGAAGFYDDGWYRHRFVDGEWMVAA